MRIDKICGIYGALTSTQAPTVVKNNGEYPYISTKDPKVLKYLYNLAKKIYVSKTNKNISIVDIGCGDGILMGFLNVAVYSNYRTFVGCCFRAEGVEIDAHSSYCFVNKIDAFNLKEIKSDVVYMYNPISDSNKMINLIDYTISIMKQDTYFVFNVASSKVENHLINLGFKKIPNLYSLYLYRK